MKRLTIAIPSQEKEQFETFIRQLSACPPDTHPLIEQIICFYQDAPPDLPASTCEIKEIKLDSFFSGPAINLLVESWQTEYLLLILPGNRVELGARALERFIQVAADTGAALVYSDF